MTEKLCKYKCNGFRVLRENKKMVQCVDTVINKDDFCKNHQYQKYYTNEQKKELKICSGCIKVYYLQNSNTCTNCQERSKKKNEKIKLSKINKCKLCKNSKNSSLGEYCLKHKKYYHKDINDKKNVNTCKKFKRGCYNEVKNKNDICNQCKKKDHEIKNNNSNNTNDEIKDDISENNDKDKDKCKVINIKENFIDKTYSIEHVICNFKIIKNNKYCKIHKYQEIFKEDEYNKLRKYGGCKKIFKFIDSKTCNICLKRAKKTSRSRFL
jgi:hypothetical protein